MIKVKNQQFETLEQGFEIEIQIVDHCNLNCGGCNHFSCIAEPYFISLEEFENNLKKISNFYPSLKRLMFVGGEPFLHPFLKDLIILSRKYFPDLNFNIDILTNGIILNKELDNYISLINDYNITILWTPYPEINYFNLEKYLNENLNSKIQILYSRMFFAQPSIANFKKYDCKDNYKKCFRYMKPTFIIRNSKVFICPGSACMDIIGKKFDFKIDYIPNKDYLLLNDIDIQNLQEFLNNGPESICSYCDPYVEYTFWHKYKDSLQNWKEFSHLRKKDLFLNNYDYYNDYINGEKMFKYFFSNKINNNFLLDLTDPVYARSFTENQLSRIKGEIDIIIPFYRTNQKQILRLISSLKSQTIIKKCHIYLISDSSPDEELVYNLFEQEKDNLYFTFLKTPYRGGPGKAKQLGINNSFNKYIFCIDCDDLLYSNNSLEQLMINFKQNKNLDIVCGKTYSIDIQSKEDNIYDVNWDEKYPKDLHGYCYKRDFLFNKNICFENYFLNEDSDFYYSLLINNPSIKVLNNYVYIYLRGNNTSFGHNTTWKEKALSFLIVNMNSFLKCYNYNKNDYVLTLNILRGLFNMGYFSTGNGFYTKEDFCEVFSCYSYALNYLIKEYKDYFNEIQLEKSLQNTEGLKFYQKLLLLNSEYDFIKEKNISVINFNEKFFLQIKNNIYWIGE